MLLHAVVNLRNPRGGLLFAFVILHQQTRHRRAEGLQASLQRQANLIAGLRVFALAGQREHAVHGIPKLRHRLAEILLLLGRAIGGRELFFETQRGVQVFANALELRGPGGQRIRFAGIEHIAHRQPGGVQVVLHAEQLQRIAPVTVHHLALQLAQAGELRSDVERIRNNGSERDEQPEKKPGRRRALRGRLHDERIPQAAASRRRSSTRQIIVTMPKSGTSSPTGRLPEIFETKPTSQGPADPPSEASAKRIPPIRFARGPYHRESQECKWGRHLRIRGLQEKPQRWRS